jgi:hypothetical protein
MSISGGDVERTYYVLVCNNFYWLWTLATNRHDCYMQAKPYCREQDWRKELKKAGAKCVAVRIVQTGKTTK